MPEGNHNRHDGTNLDDHQKQLQKLIAYIELHEFVDQDHVTRRGNRKPFGDALGNAEQQRLKGFNKNVRRHALPFYRVLDAICLAMNDKQQTTHATVGRWFHRTRTHHAAGVFHKRPTCTTLTWGFVNYLQ